MHRIIHRAAPPREPIRRDSVNIHHRSVDGALSLWDNPEGTGLGTGERERGMAGDTHDPDAGEPRHDPDRAADAPTDVRVALGADDTGGNAGEAEGAPEADAPPEAVPTAQADDVRPRRPASETGPSVGKQLRDGWRRVVNMIATGVMVLAVVIACVLALHIVFVVFSANTGNGIVEFVNGWATDLAYGFKDLFVPKDAGIRVAVNYGLAAVVYLVAGRIIAGIIRRLG
jgi:hypothetical protein